MELCDAQAEFLLVGGWAVILYGHVRATDDMDIFVRPTVANSERVFAALVAFGAPLQAHTVTPGHFANEGDAYRFGIAPLKIEEPTNQRCIFRRSPARLQDLRTRGLSHPLHWQVRADR